MADNGKPGEKDTEASEATQEQVSHMFHDPHIQLHNRSSALKSCSVMFHE